MDNCDTIGASAPGGPSRGITELPPESSKTPAKTLVIPGNASITDWNNGKISGAGSSGSPGSHLAAYIRIVLAVGKIGASASDRCAIWRAPLSIGSFSEAFNIGAPSDHRGFALFPVLGKLSGRRSTYRPVRISRATSLICADEACRRVIQNKLNHIPFDTEKVAHMR